MTHPTHCGIYDPHGVCDCGLPERQAQATNIRIGRADAFDEVLTVLDAESIRQAVTKNDYAYSLVMRLAMDVRALKMRPAQGNLNESSQGNPK